MSEKLKRGGPFPDGLEHQEAKLLAPFPTWNNWKHVVENRLRVSFKNSYRPGEELCHEFYCMRCLQKKARRIDEEEVSDFWQRAEEQMPDFAEQYGPVIALIVKRRAITPRER